MYFDSLKLILFLKMYNYFSLLFTLQVCLVFISVMSVICYRVIMTADYCVNNSGLNCLLVTTVVSSILNAVSILILGKIYDKLAILLTNWGKCILRLKDDTTWLHGYIQIHKHKKKLSHLLSRNRQKQRLLCNVNLSTVLESLTI